MSSRQLKDIVQRVKVGFVGSCNKDYCGPDEGVPMIRTTNLRIGQVNLEDLKFIKTDFHKKNVKSQLKKNDILIARHGHNGMATLWREDYEAQCLNIVVVETNSELADSRFLTYAINSPTVKNQVMAMVGGSVQGVVNTKDIANLDIPFFSLPEQKAIAGILGKLDDKIELNRQMNQTLEQMAQALFQSWFVDFDPVIDNALAQGNEIPEALAQKAENRRNVIARSEERGTRQSTKQGNALPEHLQNLFPNKFTFNDTLNKWIPEGWEDESIYDLMDIIYGAPFSSKMFNSDKEGKPIIRIRDLKTGTPQNWSTEIHKKGTLIQKGDIVAGMDAEFRPCVWFGEDGFLNQRLFKAEAKDSSISNYFIYHSLLPLLQYEEQAQVGTTVAHLGKKDIDKFRVIKPTKTCLELFTKSTESIFSKYINNHSQLTSLKQLREVLLPQLISGKLSVPAAMLEVEEVVNE